VLGQQTESIQSPRMVLVYPFFHDLSALEENSLEDTVDPPITRDGLTAVPPGPTALGPGVPNFPAEVPEPHTIPPRLAWAGDLSLENIHRLIDSPARQKIAERILDGQSAVWVLLACGDKSKDDRAAATLQKSLAEIQDVLQLPDQQAIQEDEHYQADTKVELKIEFSVLRIPVDRGEETIFSALLLNSEPELAGHKEPIAIPIFGRGRSFFALVGEALRASAIEDHCRFLVGDCSCQVKQLNPGTDMLFATAWQERIKGSAVQEIPLPELSGIGPLAAYGENSTISSGAAEAKSAEGDQPPVAEKSEALAAPAVPALSSPPLSGRTSDSTLPSSVVVLILAVIGLIVVLAGRIWLRLNRPL